MKSHLNLKTSSNKTDAELKNDVLAKLHYEPRVKARDISVLVQEGTITLKGLVTSYWEKCAAVAAAKRVAGARTIADDIEVRLVSSTSLQRLGYCCCHSKSHSMDDDDSARNDKYNGSSSIDDTMEW